MASGVGIKCLNEARWDRSVVIIDRLATVGHLGQCSRNHSGKKPQQLSAIGEIHERGNDGELFPIGRNQEAATRARPAVRASVEQDLALRQLIYDMRTEAGLSQRSLAERMGTTQSVIPRLEEGGGARNRLDTLARVALGLNRHLVVSFPENVPKDMNSSVHVA